MKDDKTKLVIRDNAIYEIDLECLKKKEEQEAFQHKRQRKRTGKESSR